MKAIKLNITQSCKGYLNDSKTVLLAIENSEIKTTVRKNNGFFFI